MITEKIKLFICLIITILFSSLSFSQDLGAGLVGYWRFEGNTVNEINGKSLKIEGNPQVTNGRYGKAFKLNGATDFFYLNPEDTTKIFYPETGFSWSIWFKSDSLSKLTSAGWSDILMSAKDNVNNEDIYLGFGALQVQQRKLVFEVDGLGGFGGRMATPPEYYPVSGFDGSKWYCITGVKDYDSDSTFLYVDGVLVAFFKLKTSKFEPINREMYFSIGAFYEGKNGENFFNGIIDEARIYNRPLSSEEVKALSNMDSTHLQADSNPVDFGDLFCNTELTKTIYLKNKATFNQAVLKANLSENKYFDLVSIDTSNVKPNDSIKVVIKFSPIDIGKYTDTLTIFNKGYLPPLQLILAGSRNIKSYYTNGIKDDTLNFGINCYNSSKDTTFTIVVNSSSKTKIFGEISPPFVLLDTLLNLNAPAFDSSQKVVIGISFPGNSIDTSYSGFLKLTDECGKVKTISLIAVVNKPDYKISGTIDTTICPDSPTDFFIKVKNNKASNLKLLASGDNLLFDYQSEYQLKPFENGNLKITFKGIPNSGSNILNFKIGSPCGIDTTLKITVKINKIDIESPTDTVDFGTINICDQNTEAKKLIVLGNKNIDKNIKLIKVNISDPFSTELKVNDEFKKDVQQSYLVSFKPKVPGKFTSELLLVWDTCSATRRIFLKGIAQTSSYTSNQSVDFGKVLTDTSKILPFTLKNLGEASILISKIDIPIDTFEFSPALSLPLLIKSGDSAVLNIKFKPRTGIITKNLVIYDSSVCGINKKVIVLSGEGLNVANLSFKVKDIIDAVIGDSLDVIIAMTNVTNISSSGISEFSAVLSVNPSLLIPMNNTPKGTLTNNRLEIPINIPINQSIDTNNLLSLKFKVALGNVESDSIYLKSITPINGSAKAVSIPGIIAFKNICRAGGTRLFDYSGNIGLSNINPNPANGIIAINFELIEKGQTKLYLINSSGEFQKELFNQNKEIGKYILYFDSNDIPQGNYFMVMETPTNLLTKKISIIR
jgi:hypothetical protein